VWIAAANASGPKCGLCRGLKLHFAHGGTRPCSKKTSGQSWLLTDWDRASRRAPRRPISARSARKPRPALSQDATRRNSSPYSALPVPRWLWAVGRRPWMVRRGLSMPSSRPLLFLPLSSTSTYVVTFLLLGLRLLHSLHPLRYPPSRRLLSPSIADITCPRPGCILILITELLPVIPSHTHTHTQSHTPLPIMVAPVFCTYCGQKFSRNEHLERHVITRMALPVYHSLQELSLIKIEKIPM